MTPIAIVGRACVLPGALSPQALWEAVLGGRDLTSSAAADRWRVPASPLCAAADPQPDHCWSDRGGYVDGFDALWDPRGFALAPERLAGLDPLVHWLLHCAREALGEVALRPARIGAVVGNLGFPSEAMAAHADRVWRGQPAGDPRNRAMSGATAQLLVDALELQAGAFCLDAACASSLYAIKLACDALAEGQAGLMLAGAVQRADDLFLHQGFAALGALSRSGRSRPFHADADGLLPAEGCVLFALKRLSDARRDGDTIHALIRGIGLSNDGRGRGLLVPDEAGQRRAIQAALASAGLDPGQVSLLECHATGTPVGDASELRSSAAVYGARALPIGSLKSNLGHLITAAGGAGLIKLIEALRAGVLPPNRSVDVATSALAETRFELLQAPRPWPADAPRIAAISAFGFGGNNAHLIVSAEDCAGIAESVRTGSGPTGAALTRGSGPCPDAPLLAPDHSIAIVALGVCIGAAADLTAYSAAHFDGAPFAARMDAIELDLAGLRFPPNDLKQALPQQLAMLRAAREALAGVRRFPHARASVLIGMEPDPEVARYGTRWREPDPARRDGAIGPLEAAGVLGCMPNIPANRLSAQFDCGGPSYTLQAGAASGLVALRIAYRALETGEIDAALVGAVDLCDQPVARAAGNAQPGDAAVALVLKRLSDAQRDGERVLALLSGKAGRGFRRELPATGREQRGQSPLPPGLADFGAASGLVDALHATLAVHHRRHPDGRPWLSARPRSIELPVPGQPTLRIAQAGGEPRIAPTPGPRLWLYAGVDRADVVAALRADRRGGDGPARAVLVAREAELAELRQRALAHLVDGAPAGAAVHFREGPIGGELAFCFAGAGASYPGMGRELLLAMPQLLDHLATRSERLCEVLDWSFDPDAPAPTALQQLWGASALSQLQLEWTRRVLGLKPDAWMGYSSGETNALVGAGVWRDADALMEGMQASGLVTRLLGGAFEAVAPQWGRPVEWASYTLLAPVEEVRAALAGLPRVHLAIIASDFDCLIAGEAAGCALAVGRIGAQRAIRLDYPLAVHVPELDAAAAEWLALHRRASHAPHCGRIYSTAAAQAYVPGEEACAQAILAQANRSLDLRPLIRRAWEDGVRVFLEHGPGNSFARAIRQTLGEREALVLSLDRKGAGLDAALGAAAALLAAGVAVDVDALHANLAFADPPVVPQRPMRFAAHWPAVSLAAPVSQMAPAPRLPPVLDWYRAGAGLPATPRSPLQGQRGLPLHATASAGHVGGAAGYVAAPLHPVVGHVGGAAGYVAALRTTLAQLAGAQQGHIAVLAGVQQQFLMQQQRAQALLLSAAPALRGCSTPPPGLVAVAPAAIPQAPPEAASATISAASSAPRFNRHDLEIHAGGRISAIFGAAFVAQDGYARQVRMPQPPLLLCDRVIELEGEPASMGKGRIVTETDVGGQHAWAIHHGHLPAGVLIEAGQADLMLISWLGVDALNRGERVYRLLGCELTYHGVLPRHGDTLRFDIRLDGHAAQGDVRLMFFHYDCVNGERPQLSVRGGQAGFFTDAELAASAGCLWSPQQQEIVARPRLDPPAVRCTRTALTRADLDAWARGDAAACFGPGFERARTHTRTPGIQAGSMLLLDRISELALDGGPWGRGYLRAELDIRPDHWFFDGHFKNDPCMPGTLMFEACLQAMAACLAACGYTLARDGWRFEPVPELPFQLQCRGQVTPRSRLLVSEVFVEERSAGPEPTLWADLLCTIDGLKAFHARRVALRLVPDWPAEDPGFELEERPDRVRTHPDEARTHPDEARTHPDEARTHPDEVRTHPDEVRTHQRAAAPWVRTSSGRSSPLHAEAPVIAGHRFDSAALLASALGRPSAAFGPMYARFDGTARVPRLPAPPYFFISRIARVDGPIGVMRPGARVSAEYEVPDSAWYFADNGAPTMPYAVLLEAVLQPCGWLASYVGSALSVDGELCFRNLDGEGEVLAEVLPGSGTLVTEVELTKVSASGGMIIQDFAVRCRLGSTDVYRLKTTFGFFPPAALAAQAGLPEDAAMRGLLAPVSDSRFPIPEPPAPRLPTDRLRMLSRIEAFWPGGGAAGLGALRAARDVDAGEWYFKAHFFQDPVQPGSLGLEALVQALQWYLLQSDAHAGIPSPRFECIATGTPHRWKYRGQVLPHSRLVQLTLEVTARGADARGAFVIADGSLWVDGTRIYHAQGLGVRIVPGLPT